jgi:hypothetical protein
MPIFRLEGTGAAGNGIVVHYDNDLGRAVYVRFRQADDGRWEAAELYLPPEDRPLTTDDLRRVPLGQMEAFANHPDNAKALAKATGPQTLERAAQVPVRLAEKLAEQSRKRRWVPKVPVGEGSGQRGDDFYRAVAQAYLRLVSEQRTPAPELAEANAVPVTTARRWVKEARLRGFLPPGRAGKVG